MRVSEFCSLTKSDLDFESRKIRVDHQLVRERGGKYYVEKTKTECGCRFIPMTEEVYRSLKNILVNRKKLKTEMIVDGYSCFLLLDKDDKPKVALHIENEMRWAMKKYKKLYPEKPLPHITPHVFRHPYVKHKTKSFLRNSRVFKADFCAPSHSLCTEVFHFPDNINLISGVNIHTFNQCVSHGGI